MKLYVKVTEAILSCPSIYTLAQRILAPGAEGRITQAFGRYLSKRTLKALDIGCGPKLMSPVQSDLLVGVDISHIYVSRYVQNLPLNVNQITGTLCSAEQLPFKKEAFCEVRCIGLLHHLSESHAIASIKEMIRVLKEGGTLFVFDNVWPKKAIYRPLAWLIRRLDRGRWIRNEQDFLKLFESVVGVDWNYKRFTYSYNGLEGIILSGTKNRVQKEN